MELEERVVNADLWIRETEQDFEKLQEQNKAFLESCSKRHIKDPNILKNVQETLKPQNFEQLFKDNLKHESSNFYKK